MNAIRLHDYLLGITKRAETTPIWKAEITLEMVQGWPQEAIDNLKKSLDAAVQMTVQQVEEEHDIDLV